MTHRQGRKLTVERTDCMSDIFYSNYYHTVFFKLFFKFGLGPFFLNLGSNVMMVWGLLYKYARWFLVRKFDWEKRSGKCYRRQLVSGHEVVIEDLEVLEALAPDDHKDYSDLVTEWVMEVWMPLFRTLSEKQSFKLKFAETLKLVFLYAKLITVTVTSTV
jgi:hypothetical protein